MAFAAPVWLAVQGEFVGCGEAPAPPGAPPGAPPAPPGAPPAPPGVPPAPPGAPPAPPGVPPAPPGAPPAPPGAPPAPPGAPPAPPGAPPAPPGAPPALPGAPPALPGAPPAPPGVPPAPPGALPAPPGAPPRTLLDAMDDQSVLEAFHLSRPCVSFVLDLLQRQLNRSRPPGCTAEGMTLLALGYYAKGTECTRLLETTNICDGSTAVVRVSKCLAHLSSRIIVFPKCRRDQERLAEANRRFCGIPQVLGVLGAAHFRTRGRGHGEDLSPLFCNTRGYSSVASQVVCDLAGNLLSVDRCQPGSTPNYRLWAESGLKMRKVIRPEYWLIVGRGYRQSVHLLPPLAQASGVRQTGFNVAHGDARSVLSSTLARLKHRFRALQPLGFEDESLDGKQRVLEACCVLHNLANQFSVPAPPGAPGPARDPQHPARSTSPPPRGLQTGGRSRLLQETLRLAEAFCPPVGARRGVMESDEEEAAPPVY